MKKYLAPLLALFCASQVLSAQTENREITAQLAESYAELQSTYTPSFKVDGTNAKVRNVILLIGDGMGHGAVNAAMYANGGALTMTNLRTFGLVRTQSADNFTTDSAASGTALSCGFNNLTSLSRCFKKQYGCSPSQFRNRIRRTKKKF